MSFATSRNHSTGGYAVVRQAGSGQIVSDPAQLADDAELRVTVRGGEFTAVARTET